MLSKQTDFGGLRRLWALKATKSEINFQNIISEYKEEEGKAPRKNIIIY
jgi:hypothetical protein